MCKLSLVTSSCSSSWKSTVNTSWPIYYLLHFLSIYLVITCFMFPISAARLGVQDKFSTRGRIKLILNLLQLLNIWFMDMMLCSTLTSCLHLCSFRMIQEPIKRTPCFLPLVSFPLQRPARTMWSTTLTSGRSRNPKWGGRNERDSPEPRTHL